MFVEDASSDGAAADGAADVSIASAAQTLAEGAVIAITLSVHTAGHAPAMDQWLDGEFAAIARGHSAFGYYIPLRRAGALGEQQIAPALRTAVLARWMEPIGPGRSLRSAPTPLGFVRRDGASALWIAHGGLVGVTPAVNREPTDQCAIVARSIRRASLEFWSSEDVNAFVHAHKEQVGASLLGLERDSSGNWQIDRAHG